MEDHNSNNRTPQLWRKAAGELVKPVPYTPRNPEIAPVEDLPSEKPDFVKAVFGHKLLLLLGLILGVGLGVLALLLQVPMYHAGTTLEVLPVNEQFMGMSTYDPQAGSFTINNMFALTQLRIMTSPSQLKRVKVRVGFEVPPLTPPTEDWLGRLRARLGLLPSDPGAFTRLSIDISEKTAAAKVLGSTRLVELTCESPSPEVAAAFTNLMGSEYIARNTELRTGAASDTLQWLQAQLEEAKNRNDAADAKFNAYVKDQGLAFVLDQSTLDDSKLRSLQTDLATQQSDRISKQARYEMAKASPIDSMPENLDDGSIAKLRAQLNDKRQELANLLTTYTAAHYKVKQVQSQVAAIEANLQRQREAVLLRVQNEYEASLNRERLLSSAYANQTRSVANQSGKASAYNSLKRESDLAKQSYNMLLQQYSQAVVATAVPANNVRLIEPAVPDRRFPKPDPASTVAAGGIVGLVLVALILVGREMLRKRRQNLVFAGPGRSNRVLNLPELGVIPAFGKSLNSRKTLLSRGLKKNKEAVGGNNGVSWESSPELVKWDGRSFLAESFRLALTSILGRLAHQDQVVLVVTSPNPKEGKTTLVANLAMATAHTGRRVLVVDADLRRPQMHRKFHLTQEGGLWDVLHSDMLVDELLLSDYIKPTEDPCLFVMTAGVVLPEETGRALFTPRLAHLVALLREHFEAVFIDTSPVLYFPDARLVGRHCDAALLVVRSNVTERDSAVAAKDRLEQDNIQVIGTLLNDWDPNSEAAKHAAYRYQHAYSDVEGDFEYPA